MLQSSSSRKNAHPAALGVDLGSHSSKAALAFHATHDSESWRDIQILRVRLPQDRDHPETPNSPSISLFEFVAQASREEEGLVPGRHALNKDLSWPIKAILMHRAGVSVEAIRRMPGGADLLAAYEDGLITLTMEEDAVVSHLKLVSSMAAARAKAASLAITQVVLTYPNFLGEREQDDDFTRYTSYYLSLMRMLWGDEVQFHTTMEGMSLASYVCEPFHDGLASCDWAEVWRDLSNVPAVLSVNLLIVDMGGSTLNLQLLNLSFNPGETGQLLNCQTSYEPHWKLGALGGSQLSNTAIKEIVRRELRKMSGVVPPEEFSRLMYRFEECKWAVDYRCNQQKITLTGNDERFRVKIYPHQFKQVFQCFDGPIKVLREELERILRLGKDFVVLFAGGSFSQPGLRNTVDEFMDAYETDALRSDNIHMKHTFLERHDTNWSSAVSIGAAVSVLRMPLPAQVLTHSAIGLHDLTRACPEDENWIGSLTADFLFGKGARLGSTIRYLNPRKRNGRGRLHKFALVCDPTYFVGRRQGIDGLRSPPPIRIGCAEEVANGPLSTYDLGWDVLASDLPKGRVKFAVHGSDLGRLAEDPGCPQVAAQKQITMLLSCCCVDLYGQEVEDHPNNKTWELVLQTDPASKLLVVNSAQGLL
ncbi:hypothetical protein F5B21DRAFT_503993 [Xylaria acuta]|nr:hypothetical protein F5B21DRAFT_503993 [Xylaria acuta]